MSQMGKFISAASLGGIVTLTGNSGGAVSPDGSANIDIVGSGDITVAGNPAAWTLTVSLTGTTQYGVQVGDSGGGIASLAVGTDGQVLLGASGANPAFATLTSTGGTITFTPGANSLNLEAAASTGNFPDDTFYIYDDGDNTKKLAFQCSGITTSTTRTITMDDRDIDMDAVPTSVGSDSGTCTPAAGTFNVVGAGSVSTAGSGANLTVTGATTFADNVFAIQDDGDATKQLAFQCSGVTTSTTRTWTVDDRDIDFDAVPTSAATDGSAATPAAGTLTIAGGNNCTTSGAGSTVTVAVDDNVADSFSTDSGSAVPSSGVITIAGGTNCTTAGSGSTVTINASGGGGGISWNEVTGTSQAASVENGYIANNASLVTITLPSTASVGETVRVVGLGAGGVKIAQNASQYIRWDESNVSTTGATGYLQSTDDHDAVELLCTVTNNGWSVLSSKGNWTIA